MAKKSQPSKGQTGKTSRDSRTSKRSHIGDSKESMHEQRKAAEIPPKSGSGSSKKNK